MSFNASDYLSDSPGQQLKEGWQVVRVIDVLQRTSAKGNRYVEITLQADGGRIWERLNLAHPTVTVQDIAKKTLAKLMQASGIGSVRDPMQPDELLGRECEAFVQPDGEGFMKVKQYRSMQADAFQEPKANAAPSNDLPEDDIPF